MNDNLAQEMARMTIGSNQKINEYELLKDAEIVSKEELYNIIIKLNKEYHTKKGLVSNYTFDKLLKILIFKFILKIWNF